METIKLELTQIFVKVVQQGSFTKAANLLDLPKSTVSKAISQLESITQTKLLLRTTRQQSLTEAGKKYFALCIGPIQALEEAQKNIYGLDSVPIGTIKITAPEDVGVHILSPIIGSLSRTNPQLNFQLKLTDQVVDLVRDGYDLAIRLGNLNDSQLKAKYVGQLEMVLVASKQYLESCGKIESPKDLNGARFLSIGESVVSQKFTLQSGKKRSQISIKPIVTCNQMTSLLGMAKEGAGLLLVPHYLCRNDIVKKRLVRVLPDWSYLGYSVHLVSPVSMHETARIKLVSEMIKEELIKVI
ncbi:MAG: LysR family transcriptional regulator [Bdellovibrionota bacterium]|nr:LysR family transcriptional regulator [Bdellovibrionota bacterium]